MGIFSGVNVRASIRYHHHFGCPVYVVDGDLQANKGSHKKWVDRARAGVNLGFSPQHSKSVALILSLKLDWYHLNSIVDTMIYLRR